MKKLSILLGLVLISSCQKDILEEIEEVIIIPENRITLSERYSDINESTSYFRDQEKFTGYLSKDYTWDILSVPFDGHSHWHAANKNTAVLDFDGDGTTDIIAFASSFCNDHIYSDHTGKILFLSDYKNNSIPEVYDSPLRYGAGGMEVNDYNGDGVMDVLFFTTETKMNMWDGAESVGGHTDFPPVAPTLIYYSNGLKVKNIGAVTDSHAGASGDLDNDGDIDFVQVSIPSVYQGESANLPPSVSLNNGDGTFLNKELITDLGEREWSATAVDIFDVNGDGYLDLILGWRVGVPKWYEIHPQYWQGFSGPILLYGNGTGTFSISNSIELSEIFFSSRNLAMDILGFGFTDYDNDGDIDILMTITKNEPGGNFENKGYYDTYYLSLLSNENGSFRDKTEETFNSNFDETLQWPNFYGIRTIDIDNDGDIDIVPDWLANWNEFKYSTNLKWIKEGKTFLKNN